MCVSECVFCVWTKQTHPVLLPNLAVCCGNALIVAQWEEMIEEMLENIKENKRTLFWHYTT